MEPCKPRADWHDPLRIHRRILINPSRFSHFLTWLSMELWSIRECNLPNPRTRSRSLASYLCDRFWEGFVRDSIRLRVICIHSTLSIHDYPWLGSVFRTEYKIEIARMFINMSINAWFMYFTLLGGILRHSLGDFKGDHDGIGICTDTE